MSDQQQAPTAVPPHVQLIQMGTAAWVSAILSTTAQIGLVDRLVAAPLSAEELAGPMQLHAPSLHRLMRTLAALGLLTERAERPGGLTGQRRRGETDGEERSKSRSHGRAE